MERLGAERDQLLPPQGGGAGVGEPRVRRAPLLHAFETGRVGRGEVPSEAMTIFTQIGSFVGKFFKLFAEPTAYLALLLLWVRILTQPSSKRVRMIDHNQRVKFEEDLGVNFTSCVTGHHCQNSQGDRNGLFMVDFVHLNAVCISILWWAARVSLSGIVIYSLINLIKSR